MSKFKNFYLSFDIIPFIHPKYFCSLGSHSYYDPLGFLIYTKRLLESLIKSVLIQCLMPWTLFIKYENHM